MKKEDVEEKPAFKKCPMCGFEWATRDQFLSDPDIQIIGYQVNFEYLDQGILMFNHSCHGTLAMTAETFLDLYDGPVFSERATGGEACPAYCLKEDEFRACPAQCECASIREVIQIIKTWPK